MSLAATPRWLLIGNSRWHWAEQLPNGQLRGWDGSLDCGANDPLVAWASVGGRPDGGGCPPEREVLLADVPLQGCPPWLGVDRALAGWGAWREVGESVLVVDAGTVLSLTRVDARGTFWGGRLLAGLRLQLEAMANHTTLIPQILRQPQATAGQPEHSVDDRDWPKATAAAMQVGVERALAAAVIGAAREAACRWVMLTGGDGPALQDLVAPALEQQGVLVVHRPLLCLESLATLRPEHR